jgi:hypothetical protein
MEDLREHDRYPLWIEASVRLPGRQAVAVTVINISKGGALLRFVELPDAPALTGAVLEIDALGATELPISLISYEPAFGGWVAHWIPACGGRGRHRI